MSGKGGQPTLYRDTYPDQAHKLALLGATDRELADFFSVTQATLANWKIAHPEFFESILEGRDAADATVAKSLYQRACGYSHKAVKIMNVGGEVVEVPYVEHFPPDTQAASLWLRNRQPRRWRDKTEQAVSVTLEDQTDEQIKARLEALGVKLPGG